MLKQFLTEAFQSAGLVYTESETWDQEFYTLETKLSDPVYGPIIRTSVTEYLPSTTTIDIIKRDAEKETLQRVISYAKPTIVDNLTKRLERLN